VEPDRSAVSGGGEASGPVLLVEGEVWDQGGVPVVVTARAERPQPGSPHAPAAGPRRAPVVGANGAAAK
jgi:hypothetical protein